MKARESSTLVLASRSPRRQEILQRHGLVFEIVAPPFDESDLDRVLSPESFARTAADGKAASACRICQPNKYVLGADTVVALDEQIFGKPADRNQARHMLRILSGRTHRVITAVALWRVRTTEARRLALDHDISEVRFRTLDELSIEAYLLTGEWTDKAGAYGIQEEGGSLVESYRGDFETVVGLPFALVTKMLRNANVDDGSYRTQPRAQ